MKIFDDSDEYIAISKIEYGDVFKFDKEFYMKVDISEFTDSRYNDGSSFALSLDRFLIVRFIKDIEVKTTFYEPKEMHLVRKG